MTSTQVLEIIRFALSQDKDPRINDVTMDGDHKSSEVILTTDDGTRKQVWVLNTDALVETDYDGEECSTCEGVGLVSKDGPAGVPHTVPCPKCQP